MDTCQLRCTTGKESSERKPLLTAAFKQWFHDWDAAEKEKLELGLEVLRQEQNGERMSLQQRQHIATEGVVVAAVDVIRDPAVISVVAALSKQQSQQSQ